jgi:hypothetical protein
MARHILACVSRHKAGQAAAGCGTCEGAAILIPHGIGRRFTAATIKW